MSAGRRRFQGQLQKPVTQKDAIGGAGKPVLTTVAIVWADIEALSGREWLSADAHNAEVTMRIKINARPGVTAGWRFVCGAMLYDVKAALPGRNRAELFLMCTAKPMG
ncbi:Phage head-tail joining protein [compost metagenome]